MITFWQVLYWILFVLFIDFLCCFNYFLLLFPSVPPLKEGIMVLLSCRGYMSLLREFSTNLILTCLIFYLKFSCLSSILHFLDSYLNSSMSPSFTSLLSSLATRCYHWSSSKWRTSWSSKVVVEGGCQGFRYWWDGGCWDGALSWARFALSVSDSILVLLFYYNIGTWYGTRWWDILNVV